MLGLLTLQAKPEGGGPLEPCKAPHEHSALAGHTQRVDCEGRGRALRGPARILFGLGLDPNRSDAAALEAVPGVGPARAAAIVAGRQEGPYRELSDLARVRGIGPVTLRKSAEWWSFEAHPAPLSPNR